MLTELSNSTHFVFTGVTILKDKKSHTFFEKTEVIFDQIEPSALELYLNTGEYSDKSGAYGIQGMAMSFIKGINGCYLNVVGFPLNRFIREFKKL